MNMDPTPLIGALNRDPGQCCSAAALLGEGGRGAAPHGQPRRHGSLRVRPLQALLSLFVVLRRPHILVTLLISVRVHIMSSALPEALLAAREASNLTLTSRSCALANKFKLVEKYIKRVEGHSRTSTI